MEPIRINVTLDISERASSLIQMLSGPRVQVSPAPVVPEAAINPVITPMQKPEAAKAPSKEPAPQPKEEPVEEVPDEKLRQAVFEARSRFEGAAARIKNEIFPKYNIKASSSCPPERRADLLRDLENLSE